MEMFGNFVKTIPEWHTLETWTDLFNFKHPCLIFELIHQGKTLFFDQPYFYSSLRSDKIHSQG